MSSLSVSVIIPAYNRAHVIGRALRSVLSQDYDDFEIIVIDDGSSDSISQVVAGMGDPRIRLIRHQANRGAAAARNTGIRAARGTHIAFLDSDDEWLPSKLRLQLDALAAEPAAAGVASGFLLRRGPDMSVQAIVPRMFKPLAMRLMWGCDLSPGATLLCRRDCFCRIGYFDEDLHRLEDWDWLLRFAHVYELTMVHMPLAIVHASGVPSTRLVAKALDIIAVRYQPWAIQLGPSALRIFRSSLLVEKAAIAFRERRRAAAVWLTLRSLAVYPWRSSNFFRRVVQCVLADLAIVLRLRRRLLQERASSSL
jgi:glycosyltransferase involved in cell wall biosynthesis